MNQSLFFPGTEKFFGEIAKLFLKRTNLALLSVGSLAGLIIGDYTILALCLFLEIWYLCLSIKRGPLAEVAKRTHTILPKLLKELEWGVIFSFFLVLPGIIYLFLYSTERILMWGSYVESRPERLELAAVFGDVIFSALYYLFVLEGRWRRQLVTSVIWLVVGGGLAFGALWALHMHQPIPHLWVLWVLAICNFVAGFVIAPLVDNDGYRRNIIDAALYAELPSALSFPLILLIMKDMPNMEDFVSGAVAFQFFASSGLLFLIESRVRDIIPRSRRSQGSGESTIAFQFADVYETTVAGRPEFADRLPATDYLATELVDADPINDYAQTPADSVTVDETERITWQLTTVYEIPAGNEPALGDPQPPSEESQFSTQSVTETDSEPGGEGE